MIPKIIHYCWFGRGQKPDIILRCIESWIKHLPDYQIIEWNEGNFNVESNSYVLKAYEQKKWAFITDYVRLHTLYNYGGIYLDSDVEVLKPLDCFLNHRAFTGHETDNLCVTATMGSEAGHPWIKMLLDYYDNAELKDIPNTKIITKMSLPLVEKHIDGFRFLKDDVVIYPVEVFCPYDHKNLRPMPTDNSYCIHHFAGTWIGRTKVFT